MNSAYKVFRAATFPCNNLDKAAEHLDHMCHIVTNDEEIKAHHLLPWRN